MNQNESKTPKYEIITNDILNRIKNNDFSYDTVLCTEKQLSEQYEVSRITAKRALTDLEQRGILFRKRGVGSFVARNALNNLNLVPRPVSETRMVAFLLPFDITKGGMFNGIKTVNNMLSEQGCLMSIYISDISAAKEKTNIRFLLSQNISGLIYYPVRDKINLKLLNDFIFAHVPVVVIDKSTDCPYIHNIVSDNYEGGQLLTEHLLKLGHKKIGFLTTAAIEETSTIRNRFGGYLQTLLSSGITPDQQDCICVGYEVTEADIASDDSAFCNAVWQLYKSGVTAILTENDRVAQLAILACRKLNIRVPEDFSICGFDDSDIAQDYSITSIRQDFRAMGEKIGEILLASMAAPSAPIQKVSLPVSLVTRSSTCPPRR